LGGPAVYVSEGNTGKEIPVDMKEKVCVIEGESDIMWIY